MLYLIDGNSYLYRAFYALPPMFNSKGQRTNAVLGFTRMLRSILKNKDLTHLIVVFDWPNASFSRKEKFAEYKIQRQKMPEGLIGQKELLRNILAALQIQVIEMPKVEADDVIGSLSQQFCSQGIKILSSDKDMCQLVNHSVLIYDGMKNMIIDREKTLDKMGVFPEQIIDLLSLMGDSSDNIPGVKGIGPKTAIKLLQEFGDLNWIYDNLEQIKWSTHNKLTEYKEMAFLSYDLATICTDLKLDIKLLNTQYSEEKLKKEDIKKELLKIFTELDFTRIGKEFDLEEMNITQNSKLKKIKASPLTKKEQIEKLILDIRGEKQFNISFLSTKEKNEILIFYWKKTFSFDLQQKNSNLEEYFLNNILEIIKQKKDKLNIFNYKKFIKKSNAYLQKININSLKGKEQISFGF